MNLWCFVVGMMVVFVVVNNGYGDIVSGDSCDGGHNTSEDYSGSVARL